MTIVLGIHLGDKRLATALAEQIRTLGAGHNHDVLVVHPADVTLVGIEEPLREAFRSFEALPYQPSLSGWPQGPNEMAGVGMAFIARHPTLNSHFLWLEPDCLLADPAALDIIDRDYQRSGMPMLGVVVDTVFLDTRAVVGRHTVGVAVYPKNFAQVCPLVKGVTAMSAEYVRAKQIPKAFDAYFGPYTARMTSGTLLIQHLWRSRNYREVDGAIICDREPATANNRVDPNAVLIHGAKDSSLLHILESRGAHHAVVTGKEKREPQHSRTASRPEIRQSGEQSGQKSSGQNGNRSQPVSQPQAQTVVAGRPVPSKLPFPLGSPEHGRALALKRQDYKKFRTYAARNLGIKVFGVKLPMIIDAVVLKEREQGKEPWTEVFKTMPTPVESALPRWSPDEPSEGLSPAMREKMIAMRKARNLPVGAVA